MPRVWLRAALGHWRLAAVLALALGLRLLLWSQPLHEPANDEVEYIAVARDLLAGRGWVFYDTYHWLRAPLYPLFLAGSLWLAGGDLHLAALPNIALSVANVFLAYLLARRLAAHRPGEAASAAPLLAALITALLWTLATFGSLYMAETLFTFLFQLGLLCLLAWPSRSGAPDPSVQGFGKALPVAAGVLFGLATLTRSMTLLFLPVAALWLLLRALRAGAGPTSGEEKSPAPERRPSLRALLLPPLLFLAAATLTIAPWTVRNALAYGEPILVETGLSYNLWVFNEPRESRSEIHRQLEQIRNPAERSAYATARGLERLREDPAIVLRKLWPNWVFLARVKPIQDRFLLENYYQTVDLPLFAAALLFDDLLYVVIALAATAGLVARAFAERRRAPARGALGWTLGAPVWLALAWIGYAVATMLLTHGEARYRHFLFPLLIPYAALALSRARSIITARRSKEAGRSPHAAAGHLKADARDLRSIFRKPESILVLGLWAVFLWTVLTSYPWDWAAQNTARGWHTLVGDLRLRAGDYAGARAAYERAVDAHNVPDAWLRLGHARRAEGDLPGAAEAYRRAWRREPLYYPASTWYGDALRELGDEERAREAFAGSYADQQRVTDYAWRALEPAPAAAVDVGGGLDFGYVRGVYPSELIDGATARWTDGRATLRLAVGEGAPALLRLRLAAIRPDGQGAAASVCVRDVCHPLQVGAGWRTYTLPLPQGAAGQLLVEVRSETFRAPDGRELGVLIDSVEVGRG